jgi:ABC-type multidrug transport system ATPase subunit
MRSSGSSAGRKTASLKASEATPQLYQDPILIAVSLNKAGKKFGREWIFRDLSYQIAAGSKTVILGGNGSGKSTLLQVISGFITPNEGQLIYHLGGNNLSDDAVHRHISFASPYIQLVEDFTPVELISHVSEFKPMINGMKAEEFLDTVQLMHARDKLIRQFSSGMKQRLKLGLAMLSDTQLVLLDEPVSNLDPAGIEWYRGLTAKFLDQRTIVVCSNAISEEYFFCDNTLNITDYKK